MYVPVSLTHNMSTSTSSMRLQSFPSSHYILQQCVEVVFFDNSELTQTSLVGQVRSMRGVVMSDEYSSARLLI